MRRLGVLASAAGVLALLSTPALAHEVKLVAALSGEEEVPGPGTDGGTGTAEILINDEAGELCYKLTTDGTDEPTAAHIHEGPAGTAGPVAINLDYATNGPEACIMADPTELSHVLEAPADHYVNVHTAEFPKGAVRGQLSNAE